MLITTIMLAWGGASAFVATAVAQGPGDESAGSGRDHLQCTAFDQEMGFSNYWAGPSFDGLELTSVIRSCGGPPRGEPAGWDNVTYIYGDCDASRGGCAPPIEIQTWPSHLRNRGLLDIAGTPTHVEGIPATRYGGGRLEIHHPGVTVVVFGDEVARVDRFAGALVEGPPVLRDLAGYGIVFEEGCVNDVNYCQSDRIGTRRSVADYVAIAIVLFLVGPLVAFLFRPPSLASG
jgi:hypothetical protein